MAGPAAPKRRMRAPARRARIVEAALETFAERGYEGASMGEIATAAGVTRPVLYDHFASKRELFLWLLRDQADALLTDAAGRITATGTAAERMRNTLDSFLASVQAHPFAWRLLLRESTGDPELVAEHRRISERDTQAIRGLLAPDIERAGIDPESPRAIAAVTLVVSGIVGMTLWWNEHPDVPRETLVDAAMDVLWSGLERLA
jgi:AcrR family transcriptional regulator